MQNEQMLIQTKIHLPGTRSQLVYRHRLVQKINAIGEYALTLISAPAGFGKTTLVASHIATSNLSAAWLSLDKHDNRETQFMQYFLASLQTIDEEIGSMATKLLESMQPISMEAFFTSLINDEKLSKNAICLVLDDYQFITNKVIHDGISFLLSHRPDSFHLVICTRSDPPLPLAQLRSRNLLLELRAADLCFTEAEAGQFIYDMLGVDISPSLIKILEQRTEGWAAGLQMAALSMQGRDNLEEFVNAFAGSNRFIMDFMLEEVLSKESEEVQEFLLTTSILNRLNGDLCNAVTGMENGQALLELLEQRNLFVISLDDERKWYRYHHLFADLLKVKANQTKPKDIQQFFARASVWCENENLVNDTVEYGILSNDYERVGILIDKYWQGVSLIGDLQTVFSWLDAIPKDVIEHNVLLSITKCWVLWLSGQISRIGEWVIHAERTWNEMILSQSFDQNDPIYAQIPASLITLHSFLARYENDYDRSIELAEEALNLISQGSMSMDVNALKSMILLSLASSYDGAGMLDEAVNTYTAFIELCKKTGNIGGVTGITYRYVGTLKLLGRMQIAHSACEDALAYVKANNAMETPVAGILMVAFAELLIERNQLDLAQTYLNKGLDLGKWGGRLDAIRNAAPALVRIKLAHNDFAGALEMAENVISSLGEYPSSLALAELLAIKAQILIRQNDLIGAEVCISKAKEITGHDHGQTGVRVQLAKLRLLFTQGKSQTGMNLLLDEISFAEKYNRFGVLIQLYVFYSIVCWQADDYSMAMSELEKAFRIGESEGYIRVFLDEGKPMKMLLSHWIHENRNHRYFEYAKQLQAQFVLEPSATSQGQDQIDDLDVKTRANQALFEPISEREMEVLELMALGMTNKEIAKKLIVATGTIKAHAANIYRKLNAANRTEAVKHARDIQLIS